MPTLVENLDLISKTIENMLDFVAKDETLSKDFEQYLKVNRVHVENDKDFNNVIIQYVLDMKMQDGLRVIEYYKRNNEYDEKIITALQNSFCSVFKVNRVLSNGFEATCITSNAKLTLIAMVKMTHLKQIGRFDFILSRIIELDDTCYLLEIYDVISEFNPARAAVEALRYMIQNPRTAYYKNEQKVVDLKNSVEEFYNNFKEYFNSEYVITINKKADELIERFNQYQALKEKDDYSNLIEKVSKNRFFKIDEFESDDSNFLKSAMGGFSSHKETYDIGLFSDSKRGLYIIPFLETFFKCFKEEIDGKDECIKEFLTSDKVPPSILKIAYDENENFLEVVNNALKTEFSSFEEVLFNTKAAFIDEGIYSPITILYNSELFSQLLGYEKDNAQVIPEEKPKNVGRNEPCPCGSGLKYKNCCGKNNI